MSTTASPEGVYLTADATEDLDEVAWDPHRAYVIGGIVDRNRLTNACLHRAATLGVRAVRLPVAKFVPKMDSTKVLTVTHVLELLLRRGGGGEEWPDAFAHTLPTRKDTAGAAATTAKAAAAAAAAAVAR